MIPSRAPDAKRPGLATCRPAGRGCAVHHHAVYCAPRGGGRSYMCTVFFFLLMRLLHVAAPVASSGVRSSPRVLNRRNNATGWWREGVGTYRAI